MSGRGSHDPLPRVVVVDCPELAGTGTALALAEALGVVLVLGGGLLLVLARHRRARNASLLVLLLASTALWGLSGSPPARAAPDCPPIGPNRLVITQTSVNDGLAPGRDPELITGRIVNRSSTDTFVTAITVSIAGVVKAPHAVAGPCGVDDYVLLRTVMPVGRRLAPGGSTTFHGAFIGFNNKSVNQDACQGARLTLHYVSS
jgi:hypothetical protein